jgi:DNA-binding XRE family transcriptional regulator
MTKPINPAVIGALVREGREAAGLTQTQLAERIGASRFWVAAFEKGKPSVELGLALKAIQALGMSIRIQPDADTSTPQASGPSRGPSANRSSHTSLDTIIAKATLTHVAPSQVTGWPGAIPPTTSTRSDD